MLINFACLIYFSAFTIFMLTLPTPMDGNHFVESKKHTTFVLYLQFIKSM